MSRRGAGAARPSPRPNVAVISAAPCLGDDASAAAGTASAENSIAFPLADATLKGPASFRGIDILIATGQLDSSSHSNSRKGMPSVAWATSPENGQAAANRMAAESDLEARAALKHNEAYTMRTGRSSGRTQNASRAASAGRTARHRERAGPHRQTATSVPRHSREVFSPQSNSANEACRQETLFKELGRELRSIVL
eukprot:gnl/TRDRNA2_/TRDRNA2_99271_c0_seq3.p1 gnl/TRDRNA2_/TRDRNA2_99271_c0~~gnl/TRDRNA2_/TRDRNA2_99271_c0_seq3.p1  ORF type:complete len:197 (+),score=21.87 gnl/TRDRNA2_/TRDRNA2_99271_c0_seq3:609-1199(+)